MSTTAHFTVACPSCLSEFPVDPERVPSEGVPAICSRCMRVFRVHPPAEGVGDGAAAPAPDTFEPEDLSWEEPVGDAFEPAESSWEKPADAGPGLDVPDTPPEVEDFAESEDEATQEATGGFEEVGWPEEPEVSGEFIELEELETSDPLEPPEPRESPEAPQEVVDALPEPEPPAAAPAPPGVEGKTLSQGVARFGRRDPKERARRLARVLVSDMITYHPARYEEALENDSLRQLFQEEVEKSWKEYVDQVGEELAESSNHFVEALNEILARGRTLYEGPGRPR